MYILTSTVHEIVNAIEKLDIQKNETVFIMLAEQELPDIAYLISELNKRKIHFIGAIFPGLIYGPKKCNKGAIIFTLPAMQKPILIQDISNSPHELEKMIQPFRSIKKKSSTAFIIVDSQSSNISSFLSSFFNLFADSIEYIGCGAGFLDVSSRKCIFTPDGFFQDAAIISFVDMECKLGVHHGWKKAIGPIVVTESDGIIIKELNWRNAFEVYREIVESDFGKKFTGNDFYETSRHYPFGIYTENHEDLVREVIIASNEGYLICGGDVPENAVLNILKSDKASQISSAEKILKDCFSEKDLHVKYCLVLDCIGRTIYHPKDFEEELVAISNGLKARNVETIPEGVLSRGEIASMGEDMIEFLNKTIVVGIFHE
ncbi:FIST C-terminal domain-containing protein [Methanolobus sp.]|jgi:hypothetical protein|uniref:FIST signal transduction protein n=1 Tax=Methanolobus sp. TaxID=1874737 RepID=UPI0025EF9AB7|nr:FIST C-terminal domain-containing protein [Methanolobus sp.]